MRIVVALAIALLALCSACSASTSAVQAGRSSSGAATGTVEGTLHLNGGPSPGMDEATSGEVYVFASAGLTGAPVATTKAGADGRFRVQLAAGIYYLAATSPGYLLDPALATPPCTSADPATVTAGRISQIRITCEMK
jgi:hypothetical protein